MAFQATTLSSLRGGVKESGYVSLGRRNKPTQSIFALAQGPMVDGVSHKTVTQKKKKTIRIMRMMKMTT